MANDLLRHAYYSTLIYLKDLGESGGVDVVVREEILCQDSCFSTRVCRLLENSAKMGGSPLVTVNAKPNQCPDDGDAHGRFVALYLFDI
jgi:hypothetical protein